MSKFSSSFAHGKNAEELFKSLMEQMGWNVTPATTHQNKIEHWDFKIEKEGELTLTVDVKAQKRISRWHPDLSDRIWIEWYGITGHEGWIYGEADYIALQFENSFWMVKRVDLLKRAKELVLDEFVERSSEALYRLYRRKDRQDLLTMIKYSDIADIATIWTPVELDRT